jgi:SsrA-binding protein
MAKNKAKQKIEENPSNKEIAVNKKARFQYEVLDTWEAGISLVGTEVKSLRAKLVNLSDAFGRIKNGEAFLLNLHISHYKHGNQFNHEPARERKLLLHKKEIIKIGSLVKEKGLTFIPLKIYITKGKVKILLGLCRGKQLHDKRQDMKEKDSKRELERAIKKYT